MALIPVHFEYLTGLRQPLFRGARLSGSWSTDGRYAEQWSNTSMQLFTAADGCPAFRATVNLDDSQVGWEFRWGVYVDTDQQPDQWGIATEVSDTNSRERYRRFTLQQADQIERYYLTHCRRLGANKFYRDEQSPPAIRFAVWAPNAQNVELVLGEPVGGYIWNDGRGITATIPMHRDGEGIWSTEVGDAPTLAGFAEFDHAPYMYRITKDDGTVAYRTDLYSRCQIGSGGINPEMTPSWSGRWHDLDGSISCSVVIDPERVTELFHENGWSETRWLSTGSRLSPHYMYLP